MDNIYTKIRLSLRKRTVELISHQLKSFKQKKFKDSLDYDYIYKSKIKQDEYINMNNYLIDNIVKDIIDENSNNINLLESIDDSTILKYLYKYLSEIFP